jgi:hypothetical protein
MEGPGIGAIREIIAVGSLSAKPGCTGNQPYRYDYKVTANQSLIDDIEKIKPVGYEMKKNIDGSQDYKFALAVLPPENRSAVFAFTTIRAFPLTAKSPNANSQKYFGVVSKKLSYTSGLLKSLEVIHDRDNGTAQMTVSLRNFPPSGQIMSFGMSSSYSGLYPTSGMVCSETEGAQLRNFPKIKLSYPYPYEDKIKAISMTGKQISILWEQPDLKGLNSWMDSFSTLPTCFGVSTWIKKREYSSGSNCTGFIQNGFLNANCSPYSGWNSWEEVNKSWRVLFPAPKI